jgi:hypothetical protein
MARLASEGNVKIYKLPEVADLSAPTEAEIAAGVHLTPYVPTTGVEITWTQNNASLAMLEESFVASVVGTEEASIVLTGVRDDDSDDFWNAFTRGENFVLLVSRFGQAETGSQVECYPAQSHRPTPLAPAQNEFQQAQVTLAVPETPVLDAVVAA